MESLSPTWRLAISGLVGLYLGYISLRALRTGVYRYKGRSHDRSAEPKTFWMGVIWSGLLALVALGYALMQALTVARPPA
ncbi:MAG TPA: hypothetical protein VG712_00635 [Gemmatimonadales bacterium]|nr:hypothetical protein [Gemmatimonadales bacterium]